MDAGASLTQRVTSLMAWAHPSGGPLMAAVGPWAAGGGALPPRPPRALPQRGWRPPGGAGIWLWLTLLCSFGATASATWHMGYADDAPLDGANTGKHGKEQKQWGRL